MNENIILLMAILIAFTLQTLFYSKHIKVINLKICELQERGNVLVGKKTHFFKGGVITMFLLGEDDFIKEAYILKGRTSLSKIKRFEDFENININDMDKEISNHKNVLIKESVLNALSYYNKYQINQNM